MSTSSRPNVVLLISDNQRLDTLGILDRTACRTPTWDRVAREGVLIENLRTTSPICSPARASFFTGFQPHQAGMPHLPYLGALRVGEEAEYPDMEITRPPISHYFREEGYQCLYAGKWHLGTQNIQRWSVPVTTGNVPTPSGVAGRECLMGSSFTTTSVAVPIVPPIIPK